MGVYVRVPAKVNLALCVGGTDQEGYHELGTVFQALSLYDEVTAEPAPPGVFASTVRGEGAAYVPDDDGNLAVRAARLLAEEHGVGDAGVLLHVRKRIPVAGGMAGGSADAAAALVACNELWGLDLTPDRLQAIGARLGADVPFMLRGGTALGRGRGDLLEQVPVQGTYHWTLALSHAGLSTPAVFREYDAKAPAPDTRVPPALLDALRTGDVQAVGASLVNHLQAPAIRLLPALARTLEIGLAAGALGCIVSGSGPTCAFLSGTAEEAAELAEALARSSAVRAVRQAEGPVAGAELGGAHGRG